MPYDSILEPPPDSFKQIASNAMNIMLTVNIFPEGSPVMFVYENQPVHIDWFHGDTEFRESVRDIATRKLNKHLHTTVTGALIIAHAMFYTDQTKMAQTIIDTAEWIAWWSKASKHDYANIVHQQDGVVTFCKITNSIMAGL